VCVRIGMAGGRVAVDRGVRVAHHKAHSSSNVRDEDRRLEGARAYATYFHIHSSPWETTLVAVAAYLGCVARHLVDRVLLRSRGSSGAFARYGLLLRVLWSDVRQAYLGRPPARPAHAVFLDP
jgi:GT2 family glycosyltransferase